MSIVITILAWFAIWFAANLKRKKDSKIALFSGSWWLQVLLITIGVVVIKNIDKWLK